MSMPTVGQLAPPFEGVDDSEKNIRLADFKGQKVVLYFYPKDNTPGCTTQACDLTDNLSLFNQLNVAVIGVSRDSVSSHKKFKEKHGLKFSLVSDPDGHICALYGTWVEKSMFGRKYMGVQRATFLIDEKGVISHVWPKVDVINHVKDLLTALEAHD